MIYEKTTESIGDKVVLDGYFKSSNGTETVFFKRIKYKENEILIESEKSQINLIFVHDLLEYHGRYLSMANSLLDHFKRKVSVSLIDLRGHGLSTGTRHYIETFEDFSLDLIIFLRYLRLINENKENKCILVGQGMGSLVCLEAYLNSNDLIDGFIISNPLLKNFIPFLGFFNKNNKYLKWPCLAFKVPFHFNGFDVIKNIDLAEKFNSDPLIGHYVTLGLMLEILGSIKKVKKKAYLIDKPMLMLVSKDSRFSDYSTNKIFHKTINRDYISYFEFDRMKHDIINSKNKKIVYKKIVDWIKENIF